MIRRSNEPPIRPAIPISTDPAERMRYIWDLVPFWETHTLDACPYPGMWGFNPSIMRRTSGEWLCSVRCATYSMPGGVVEFSYTCPAGGIINKNVIVELDPVAWQIRGTWECKEIDGAPRLSTKCVGFEDLRLVETASGDLLAIATAMQMNDRGKQEICVLLLDDDYQIVEASPLRGAWSTGHQKNWSPFQHHKALRLLHSVERGGIYNWTGVLTKGHAPARPTPILDAPAAFAQIAAAQVQTPKLGSSPTRGTGIEVRAMPGRAPKMAAPDHGTRVEDPFPLRGGSQLVPLADYGRPGEWLGISHGMRMAGSLKLYWHVLYTCDINGRMIARSVPMKLSEHGIEFCAGLAIDPKHLMSPRAGVGDRIVCSFGTEDREAHLGITSLEAVLALLEPVEYSA